MDLATRTPSFGTLKRRPTPSAYNRWTHVMDKSVDHRPRAKRNHTRVLFSSELAKVRFIRRVFSKVLPSSRNSIALSYCHVILLVRGACMEWAVRNEAVLQRSSHQRFSLARG